ncbi:hypothetical protein EJ02DRAFT_97415 [Clathrospora elynae]|uniref:Uncharacterized protein n=1 Tax=Clathrospora elynae TaxID=706981 RepID=A0A6A5S6F2_9PLEO|nr:hypothetical protein EJ02DRAFT_97415 [Clathrospora elynae]
MDPSQRYEGALADGHSPISLDDVPATAPRRDAANPFGVPAHHVHEPGADIFSEAWNSSPGLQAGLLLLEAPTPPLPELELQQYQYQQQFQPILPTSWDSDHLHQDLYQPHFWSQDDALPQFSDTRQATASNPSTNISTPPGLDDAFHPLFQWIAQSRQPAHPSHISQRDYTKSFGTSYEAQHGTYSLEDLQVHGRQEIGQGLCAHPNCRQDNREDLQSGLTRRPINVAEAPPRLHPFAKILHSPDQPRPAPAPPIQQWPLRREGVDKETLRKQEIYRQKGAARRQSITSSTSTSTPGNIALTPRKGPGTRKRKGGIIADLVPPTPPPPLRHSYGYHGYDLDPQQPHFKTMDPASQQQLYAADPSALYLPYQTYAAPSLFNAQPHLVAPPQPLDREAVHQPITSVYQAYLRPIKLYELDATSIYDFAQLFVEDYFNINIYSNAQYKWHAHTTTGFIKGGNRKSLLVLHNAANPFKWGNAVQSTTSIGVYGRYAHEHSEIHWTTVTPGLAHFVTASVEQGFVGLKQTWHVDMVKASDRRFHKAYWLAANMLPLKGLLNHRILAEKAHDALHEEEFAEDFVIGEEDLQTGWDGLDISVEESARIWQRLLDEIECGDVDAEWAEHIETGGTERDGSAACYS